ncbi:hypothetical protein [Streptosporangium saharense]|uniref:Uncharacterized protein n=1 Tax=Streptosporangium saharense TaxID=1706840 RepID=A0A7W7VMB6_9ACTN|nr:hypothetical protein [Streptosporangium saharense]MBB4915090.1 hypothetical protein [Streptosporangium saharense]
MSYKARLTERTLTLKTPAAGTHVLWRAPVACKVKAVRAYRLAGTGAVVNAQKNGGNLLAQDLSVDAAATWKSATPAVAAAKLAAGDTLSAVIVSVAGSPTDLTVQIDIELDADV